jgi:hypothetical protein
MGDIKKPQFNLYYYKKYNKGDDYYQSWIDYNKDNQRSEYVANMIVNGVKEVNKENISCLKEINSTLSDGFSNIQNELNDINLNLELVNDTLESGFYNLKVNQIKQIQISLTTNLKLDDLKILTSFSDSAKERFQLIKEGLKFMSNVGINEEYYDDAFRCFSKVVNIKDTDYFSLFFLGYISTFSKQHINPNNAIDYYKKSLKYALIDDNNDNEIKILNDFYTNVDEKLSGKCLIDSLYLLSAQCYYLIDDNENALKNALLISNNSFVNNFTFQLKYASRLNEKNEIIKIINRIFNEHIKDYENILCDIDVLNNLFTLNYLKDTIKDIEKSYNQLKDEYISSNENFEVIINIKNSIAVEVDTINKKILVDYYTNSFIEDEISKQIDFEKMMSSEINEIDGKYSDYIELKGNYHSAKSELTNKFVKLKKSSDIGGNIMYNYLKYYILLSVLIVIYVLFKYDIGTAIGYSIMIIICEIGIFFVGFFMTILIGNSLENGINDKINAAEKESKNLSKSNEEVLNNYEKDIKERKNNLQYYIDKHMSYKYSLPFQQRLNSINL